MKNPSFIFLFIAFTTIIVSCKKEKTAEDELAKLPLATQTGANTFGCLVNGKAWVAQNQDCFLLCDPSFKMYFDSYRGGSLSLIAIWLDSKREIDQRLTLAFDSANFKMEHTFNSVDEIKFSFTNYNSIYGCGNFHSIDSIVQTNGSIIISKYDLSADIISGTFQFTLFKPGCDTIKVTNGRFDKKL